MFTSVWDAVDGAKLRKRFDGRLDIRAPEDMFATDEQVRDQFRRPIAQPHIDTAIDGLLRAWLEGDRDRATSAADEVERRTRAHFQAQGVPVFAHPIVPPQFVHRVFEVVQAFSTQDQRIALDELISHFKPDLRPGVSQELNHLARPVRTEGRHSALRADPPAEGASLLRSADERVLEEVNTALDQSRQRGVESRQLEQPRDFIDARQGQSNGDRRSINQLSLILPASANVTAQGQLTDVSIETPSIKSWGPTNHKAAGVITTRIKVIGAAIQKSGTDEEKKAWSVIKRIVLDDKALGTGGAAENDNDVLRIDLSRVAPGGDPRKDVDEAYALFLLAHEVFHSTESDRKAQLAAQTMQKASGLKGAEMGSPRWSAEVRNDKRVYDFLVRAGLIDPKVTPIEKIAPYYAQHLKNPHVPVIAFPGVPGYDEPLH